MSSPNTDAASLMDAKNPISPSGPDTEKAIDSPPPPSMDFPDGGLRAWMVAVGASAVLFATFGYVNAFGVYQNYYITHQLKDRSASDISWIGSLQTFFLFGAGIIGGPLFDRYGAKVIWAPCVIVVFSVMMTSLCTEYYQFMLAQGVCGGIAMGMALSPALSSTAQYFQKRRGIAVAITVAGSSLGGVIFPIALDQMLDSSLGFGWSIRIIGFIQLGMFAAAFFGIRERLPPRKRQIFKFEAFKKLPYVTTVSAVFLLNIGLFTPFFYLPEYAQSHHMSSRLSYYLIAILNSSSFFGRLIPGMMADKFGTLNMLACISSISGILTLCWIRMTDNASIIVFSALYGFFSGGMVSLTPPAIANNADSPQDIGTYIGMGMGVMSIATLIGPPIDGALANRYGGFLQVQIFSGVMILGGAMFVVLAKWTHGKGLISRG